MWQLIMNLLQKLVSSLAMMAVLLNKHSQQKAHPGPFRNSMENRRQCRICLRTDHKTRDCPERSCDEEFVRLSPQMAEKMKMMEAELITRSGEPRESRRKQAPAERSCRVPRDGLDSRSAVGVFLGGCGGADCALTASRADYPSLKNARSDDLVMNIMKSVESRLLALQWKKMVWQGKMRWKRNPRWLSLMISATRWRLCEVTSERCDRRSELRMLSRGGEDGTSPTRSAAAFQSIRNLE